MHGDKEGRHQFLEKNRVAASEVHHMLQAREVIRGCWRLLREQACGRMPRIGQEWTPEIMAGERACSTNAYP